MSRRGGRKKDRWMIWGMKIEMGMKVAVAEKVGKKKPLKLG